MDTKWIMTLDRTLTDDLCSWISEAAFEVPVTPITSAWI